MLVSIVLSALPAEEIPLPFSAGHQERHTGTATVTDEAETVFRLVEGVDGGAVTAPDPGSVHLGGVIEVFPGVEAARIRAERLQAPAARSPAHAEHAYLKGRVLLRLSPYLTESVSDACAAPFDAPEVVRPARENTADA
ncbi:hypothetical protein ACFVOK_09205 [Streptomyces sp. NPDC057798]